MNVSNLQKRRYSIYTRNIRHGEYHYDPTT